METKITSHITKGLIISLILVILDLVAGFANFKFATWFRWIPTIILVASIIWACISYGSQLNHNVTFGNVFAHGFKTTAVVACIVTLFTVLSLLVIFPETKDIALDQARKQMEAKGNMPEETIDKALEMTKKFFLPFAIAGAVFGTIIVGLIASLIGAGITKKNPPSPFEQKP